MTKFFKGYEKSFLTKELKKGQDSKFIDKVKSKLIEKIKEITTDNKTKTEKKFIEKAMEYTKDNNHIFYIFFLVEIL